MAVDSGCGIVTQGLVTLGFNSQGISTGIQILEHEHTIVVVVGGIAAYLLTVLVQDNHCSVEGSPLVHSTGIVVVQIVNKVILDILNGTHDVTLAFGRQTEVFSDTASDTDTLLMAIVHVQGTVAGRLIGVEVTFNQEAGSTMFQHAQITGIGNTCIWIDACR